MTVRTVTVKDVFDTNAYFYIDELTRHGFLIDPGAQPEMLLKIIQDNGWGIEKILLTHGHFDHIGAAQTLAETLHIPCCIHVRGQKYLESTHFNLSRYCNRHIVLRGAVYFTDGEILCLQSNTDFSLQVLYTPGHTEDSCIFYSKRDSLAFVGDTIFAGSIGSTQYPGSSAADLQNSILQTVFRLPLSTVLLSGHSEPTSVGTEIKRYL